MNAVTIQSIIDNYKRGQFHNIEWHKELKTRKGIECKITKESHAVVRLGVDYSNKQSVIDKRESGELPSEPQPLPYGHWKQFPYLIEHNGGLQLRVTTAENTKTYTKYFINGVEAKKDDIRGFVLKSELPDSKDKNEVFNLKIENIVKIK